MNRSLSFGVIVALFLGLDGTTASAKDTLEYRMSAAKGPYFLCDDRVTEDRWGIERFVVPPQRHEAHPLIVRDYAWEGSGPHMGGSVLFDPEDGLFKMWYSVFDREAYDRKGPFSYNVCYAESKDGVRWTKPMLGVFDYMGSTQNNCIRLGTDKTQNIDVCLNPQPRRYRGKFLAIHNQKGGVFVSSSDDGKSFRRLWPEAPVIGYHSDTHNNFVFDEVRRTWLLYCRPRAYAGDHKRRISLTQTRDLSRWPHERTILVPTETESPEFYGMAVFRRGDLFFGLLQVYNRATGRLHCELAWSSDGLRWSQLPSHPAFAEPGPPGAWDAGMVLLAESPVVVNDELWFYYGGFQKDHNAEDNPYAIGLLKSERDRLIGLRPSSKSPGYILTRPFNPSGKRLMVNARVAGELRAELRVGNNKTVEGWTLTDCNPVRESGFARELTWHGMPLGHCGLKEVQIRFELRDAELFTLDLGEEG
jgi:hypothetical protein